MESIETIKNINILQINLNHCRAANTLLSKYITDKNIHIALIQDPYLHDGRLYAFPINSKKYFSNNKEAVIIVSRKLSCNRAFVSETSVFVNISDQNNNIFTIGTQYIRPRADFLQKIMEWESIIRESKYFIIGADMNAQSESFGYTRESERGRILIDFMLKYDLVRMNKGNAPTFESSTASGQPDITIASQMALKYIENWHVTIDYTASDHNYISYQLNLKPIEYVRIPFKKN